MTPSASAPLPAFSTRQCGAEDSIFAVAGCCDSMGDADELHAADAADIGGKQLRAPPGLALSASS